MKSVKCDMQLTFPGHGDQYFCAHPQVFTLNSLVTMPMCCRCPLRLEPPPANARPLPRHLRPAQDQEDCLFLSRCDGAAGEVGCRHPNHDIANAEICRQCDDFESPLMPFGSPIATWAVGVTTAPRAVCTLEQTIVSLEQAGWNSIQIFAEPGSQPIDSRESIAWHQRSKTLGAFSNWYLSLTELVMREPFVDAYLLCQDDIFVCRDLRAYLEKRLWLRPNPQIVSVYCAEVHDEQEDIGFFPVDAGWDMCGALALVFPNAVARALLCDNMFFHHRRHGPRQGHSSIDSVVGHWCRSSGIEVFMHHPSLVEHTGDISSLWGGETPPSPRRRPGSSLPRSESALSLLPPHNSTTLPGVF